MSEVDPKDRPVIPRQDSCNNPACTGIVSSKSHVLDGRGRPYCSPACVQFAHDLLGRRMDDPGE